MTREQLVGTILAVLAGAGVSSGGVVTVEAVTRPYEDVTLSFTTPGMIAQLCVPDGKPAAKGKPLVKLDTSAEQAQVAVLEATGLANSTRIDARKEQLEQSKIKLKMIEVAYAGKGATELQLKDAQLEVKIADIQLRLEQFEQQKNEKEIAKLKAEIARMTINSPIDGRVEETFVKQGESVDRLTKVIRVVNVQKFRVEAMVPLETARRLAVDAGGARSAKVLFPGGSRVPAAIEHIRSEADSGSDKLMVRVEVPNESGRKAGEHVSVEFAAPDTAAPASGPAHLSPGGPANGTNP